MEIRRGFLNLCFLCVFRELLAVPTTLPTRESTVELPPTLDTTDPTIYDHKVRNRIEGYAIVASAVGVILLLSLCRHFFLQMKYLDSSSAGWKFCHLTLAQLEEQNMIVELEALFSQQTSCGDFDLPFDEQETQEVDEEPETEPRLQDLGVVVGTQVNSL
jgi:hypothetical protein